MTLKTFVDSDVVISSLISSTGAAFLLLNQIDTLELFVSNISINELATVTKRLHLNQETLAALIEKRCTVVQLKQTVQQIKTSFAQYVLDIGDAHVVAGANECKAAFLISYNTKHFKSDKLKKDFNIMLTTPANLLQYLRSLS